MRTLLLAVAVAASPALAFSATTSASGRRAAVSSSRVDALIAEGQRSLAARRFSGAIAIFKQAAGADPRRADVHAHLGNSYFQRAFRLGTPERADLRDAALAVSAYEAALKVDPGLHTLRAPFLVHHGMGQCLEALGRYDEAAERMRIASETAPRNPMPPLYSAALRMRLGQGRGAAEDLHASAQRARAGGTYPTLAKLVRTHPQFAELARSPRHREILSIYDELQSGRISESDAMERVEMRLTLRDSLRDPALARRRGRRGMTASYAVDPKVQAYVDEGDARYKRRQYHPAIAAYLQALYDDQAKGTLSSSRRGAVMERLGTAYRRLGLTSEAIKTLESAARERPEGSSAYYQLALALSTDGKLTSSLQALGLALWNAETKAELKRTMMMARTDTELEPVRDLPAFRQLLLVHSRRASDLP